MPLDKAKQLECAACIGDQTFAQARAVYGVLRKLDEFKHMTDEAVARRAAEEMAAFGGWTDEEAAELVADALQHHVMFNFGIPVEGWNPRSLVE